MGELKAFRYVALAEATSFLLLLVATIVKYQADAPIGVKVLGPVHGALFLAYALLGLLVAIRLEWRPWKAVAVLFAAVVPFGGYVVDRKVLAGAEEATATPAVVPEV